jgi:hypothetical protein
MQSKGGPSVQRPCVKWSSCTHLQSRRHVLGFCLSLSVDLWWRGCVCHPLAFHKPCGHFKHLPTCWPSKWIVKQLFFFLACRPCENPDDPQVITWDKHDPCCIYDINHHYMSTVNFSRLGKTNCLLDDWRSRSIYDNAEILFNERLSLILVARRFPQSAAVCMVVVPRRKTRAWVVWRWPRLIPARCREVRPWSLYLRSSSVLHM